MIPGRLSGLLKNQPPLLANPLKLQPSIPMKQITAIALAAILGGASLLAAPPASEQAVERIIKAAMPLPKQKELFAKAADRMVDQIAQKKTLPPACAEEMRTALRNFMGKLADEGVLNKIAISQFREKLTDEELVTLAAFLESSVGQKLVNRTISLSVDKERLNRDMKDILDSKKTELVGVMVRIMEKHGVAVN